MDLYLVRHAIAADRAEGTFPNDDERPLTPEGIHKFRLAARGLSELGMKPGRIVSSPLLRAKQTAEILRDAVAKDVAITISASLTPNAEYVALLKALVPYAEEEVAVVGHEPHLSGLASYLLVGGDAAVLEFKKGAVALLKFPDRAAPGAGSLEWLIQPGALRLLAKD
jgi:phosphohistidine phosphatase